MAVTGHIGDDHADGTVSLGLQGEYPVIFERRGQRRRHDQGLAQQFADGLRIVVPVQSLGIGGSEPDQTAPDIGVLDAERLNKVQKSGSVGHTF